MSISSLLQVIAQEANRPKGLRPQDVFNTTNYIGTNAARTINNGIDLAGNGGMIWERYREASQNHSFVDSKRGITKYILPHSTAAEGTDTNYVQSFNSNGFSLLNDFTAGLNVVSRTFRIAPKFLDIVTYTGTSVARSIPHSLGIAPGFMMIKRLNSTNPWKVFHAAMPGATERSFQLSAATYTADGAAIWNTTAPTDTHFSVGGDASVNASSSPYVAYLFAHDPSPAGVIQCGVYVGNGSATGPTINLGWEPQFLLVKNITQSTNWIVLDQATAFASGADAILTLNTTAAIASSARADPSSTGFTVNTTASDVNFLNNYHIYMAIKKAV